MTLKCRDEKSIYAFSLLSLFYFIFFSLCRVTFSYDVPVGIFTMSMLFSPNFCLDHPLGCSQVGMLISTGWCTIHNFILYLD